MAYGKGRFGVWDGNRTTHWKRTGIAAMKYRFGVRDEIAVRQGEVIVVNNGESERAGGDLHLQGGALPGLSDLSQVPELCQCQTNVLREQRLWSCSHALCKAERLPAALAPLPVAIRRPAGISKNTPGSRFKPHKSPRAPL